MDDIATVFKLVNKTDFMSKLKLMAAVTDVVAKFNKVKTECAQDYAGLLRAAFEAYIKNVDVEDGAKCESSGLAMAPLLKSLPEDFKTKNLVKGMLDATQMLTHFSGLIEGCRPKMTETPDWYTPSEETCTGDIENAVDTLFDIYNEVEAGKVDPAKLVQ